MIKKLGRITWKVMGWLVDATGGPVPDDKPEATKRDMEKIKKAVKRK